MAARERQRDVRIGRRHRGPVSWPTLVLSSGIVLSLAANLAQAQPTPWGWVIAGTPAASFLVAVSMLERRAGEIRTARTSPQVQPAPVGGEPARTSDQPAVEESSAPSTPINEPFYADAPHLSPARADQPAPPASPTRTPPHTLATTTDDASGLAQLQNGHQPPAAPARADHADPLHDDETAAAPQVSDEVAAMRHTRHARTVPTATVHLDEITETITYPDEPPHDPQTPPARDDLVAELADQIRAQGEAWRPDYDTLMTRTGMSRRWCEYLVRDARTAAAQPRSAVRTEPARPKAGEDR
jgi:hypothetical protein